MRTHISVLLAFGPWLAFFPGRALGVTASAPNFTVNAPVEGLPLKASDSLKVSIHVANSTVDVNVAEAVFDDIHIPLTYKGSVGDFTGAVALEGLPVGERQLSIRVVDENGDSAVMVRKFRIGIPPELTVELDPYYPIPRNFRVRARCVDDDLPCKIYFYRVNPYKKIATADNAMDTVLDMSAYGEPGETLHLSAVAADAFGLESPIFESQGILDPGPPYKLIDSVPGMILDVDAHTILYQDGKYVLHDRRTGKTSRTVSSPRASSAIDAHITSVGAVIAENTMWKEWRGDTLYDSGYLYYSRVKGDFAIWWAGDLSGQNVFVRDLRLGMTRLITDRAFDMGNDVDTDGTAVYPSRAGQIMRVSPDGTEKYLGGDEIQRAFYPLISSGNVVYLKFVQKETDTGYELVLHDGDSETVLRDSGPEMHPGVDYRLKGKWIAFLKPGNTGNTQIWLRDSTGSLTKVHSTLLPALIENMGSDGSLIISETENVTIKKALFSPTGRKLADVFSPMRYREAGGNWYATAGRYLFQIDTTTLATRNIRKAGNTPQPQLACSRTRGSFQARIEKTGRYRFDLYDVRGRKAIGFDARISAPGRYAFPLGDGADRPGLLLLRATFEGVPLTPQLLAY